MGRDPRGRAGRHDDDLELVVVDDPGGDAPDVEPAGPRRFRWVLVAAAVVGVCVVVGTGLADQRRESAELARLAAVPGVLAPLPEVPDVRWATTADAPLAHDDGVVALQSFSGADVLGIALATGRPVWQLPRSGTARSCGAVQDGPLTYSAVPEASTLFCVPTPLDHPSGVEVVDVTSGAVAGPLVLEAGTQTAELVEGDVVSLVLAPDGVPVVVRRAVADGREVWRSAVPELADDAYVHGYVADGGYVVAGAEPEQEQLLDLASGARLDELPGAGTARDDDADDGRPAVERSSADGPVVEVRGDGTTAPVEIGGTLLAPVVDDGSADDVVLVRTPEGLVGHDARTGAQLWSRALSQALVAHVVLDGLVVLANGEAATVLDARTGEVAWELVHDGRPLDDPRPGSGPGLAVGLTDGRRVLLDEPGEGGGRRLVARDLRDGSEVWSYDLTLRGAPVQRADDVVLVRTLDGLAALG